MKKFLLFALCAIATCSLFAEPYSSAKYKELKQNKKHFEAIAYCYESEISAETDYNHCYHYVNKLSIDKKFRLTKNEIDAAVKKFENAGIITEQNLKSVLAVFYMQNGLINEA
jgi:hypothetical protein